MRQIRLQRSIMRNDEKELKKLKNEKLEQIIKRLKGNIECL